MPSVAKKRLLRKKFKGHYLCFSQKLASIQTIESFYWKKFVNYKTQNITWFLRIIDDLLMVMDL